MEVVDLPTRLGDWPVVVVVVVLGAERNNHPVYSERVRWYTNRRRDGDREKEEEQQQFLQ